MQIGLERAKGEIKLPRFILGLPCFFEIVEKINTNFKFTPIKRPSIEFVSVSGNNFHPFVEAYFPQDPVTQAEQSKLVWYKRNFQFQKARPNFSAFFICSK